MNSNHKYRAKCYEIIKKHSINIIKLEVYVYIHYEVLRFRTPHGPDWHCNVLVESVKSTKKNF